MASTPDGDVFIGWALGVSNRELGVDFFGSPHELIEGMKPKEKRFSVLKHLATEISSSEVRARATELPDLPGVSVHGFVKKLLEAGPGTLRQLLMEQPFFSASAEGAGLPLGIASFLGRTDLVNALLELGLPPGRPFRLGMTDLHWAAATGRRAIVERLLEAGAVSDLNWFMLTPDQLAFRNGHADLADWMEKKIPQSWKEFGLDDIIPYLAGESTSG